MGPPVEGRRALLLEVDTRAAALGTPLETALDGALSGLGYAVTPARGPGDAEARARGAGQDWLLRVRAGLVPGTRELAAVGELIPAWASFFLQRRPDARAIPPRLVQARAVADAQTLLLSREASRPGAPFATIRPLARLPGRVLALAVGEAAEPGRSVLVAVTADAVLVLSPEGRAVAERGVDRSALRPVRDPAAVAAVGDFGGGRIALQRAGAPAGEVLALKGDRLEPAGTLGAAPLCAGDASRLFGAFEPGSGVLRDRLSTLVDPETPSRSPRTLYGAACAPRAGRIAYATLGTDLRIQLLDADLRPVAAAPLESGSGFALADLDGDGTAELVASSAEPGVPERIRVLAPLSERPLLFESPPVAGSVLAAAAGDLTGDGVDDAVLAAIAPDGSTELLLLTTDPRGAP